MCFHCACGRNIDNISAFVSFPQTKPIGSTYAWFICLHLLEFYGLHVGKYTSPMDPMRNMTWFSGTWNLVSRLVGCVLLSSWWIGQGIRQNGLVTGGCAKRQTILSSGTGIGWKWKSFLGCLKGNMSGMHCIYPPASHHQDCYVLSRESKPKPLFATGILGGR